MNLADTSAAVVAWIRDHESWMAPLVFVLAFLESFAFVSLLVPATLILLGIGALIGAGGFAFFPCFVAATAGAFAGDWAAFELAGWLGPGLVRIWPLSRYPAFLSQASEWFARWGLAAVFFGRFFGPLRAGIPLVAGIARMPRLGFQAANLASALIWAAGILAPGALGLRWLMG